LNEPTSSDSVKKEAWKRLVDGESLKGLPISKKNGRVDLRGIELPEPKILERWQTALANVERFEPNGIFYSTNLQNLDFTGSKLSSLHFSDCEIRNCCFDHCNLRGLRLRATTIGECSFQGADLSGTPLGVASVTGPFAGRPNSFFEVDFSDADLRGTVYVAAAFRRCNFGNAKLARIGFGTSTFADCKFAGELREVQFWRSDLFARGYPDDAFPPNEMVDVDFRRARLRDVEFRGLTLDHVQLPDDEEHIVIRDFAKVLDQLIGALKTEGDQTAKILVAYLGGYRKWAASGARGVLNKLDLDPAGEGAVDRIVGLLRKFGVPTD
jgi:uncharacterized protein YjbI with pentapeptide repeats